MKRILTSAVALALLIGSPVLAQEHHGKRDRTEAARPNKPDKANKADRANKPARVNKPAAAARRDRTPNRVDRSRTPNRVDRNRNNRNPDANRHNNRRPNANRNDNRNRNLNRNQQRPRNFDRRSYQRNFNAHRKFRGGYYNKPRGWYYRRWSYGQVLPFAFFASNYWLNDYYAFDLPVPPYGYEWVRYGNDAILVNTRSGQILQVQYGVFY